MRDCLKPSAKNISLPTASFISLCKLQMLPNEDLMPENLATTVVYVLRMK